MNRKMEGATQNPITIVVLLALAGVFLWLHFTNGSGTLRLWLAGVLVAAAVILLLPSLQLSLPEWLQPLESLPKIQLGLDLQGGTHLLLEVKLQEAVKTSLRRSGDDIEREAKDNKLTPPQISQNPDGSLLIKLKNPDERSAFQDLMSRAFTDLTLAPAPTQGGAYVANFTQPEAIQIRTNAMDQALETIRNRIDQLGVRETTVAREGDNDILVQLPGIQDPERAKELIGKTAVLEFKLIDESHPVEDAIKNGPPPGDEVLYGTTERGGRTPYLVESPVLMTGDTVTDARVRPGGRLEGPYVSVELDNRGAEIFDAMTADNVGRRLAIILDKTVYSDPVIRERIPGGHVQI